MGREIQVRFVMFVAQSSSQQEERDFDGSTKHNPRKLIFLSIIMNRI